MIDSTPNFIEHPRVVAERIARFAGTDCSFSTFAGVGAVDPDIVYAKLVALAEGAVLASRNLWKA